VGHKFNFDISTFARDDILQMNIDDLYKNISKLRRLIKETRMLGLDSTQYEIEFCYLEQERDTRNQAENTSKKRQKNNRSN
jgi:hypothetical protein